MIEASARLCRNGCSLWTDLDEQKFMMGAAGRICRNARSMHDLFPAQNVAIESPGGLEVFDVEDDMSELLHFHSQLPPSEANPCLRRAATLRCALPTNRGCRRSLHTVPGIVARASHRPKNSRRLPCGSDRPTSSR